MRSVVLKKIHHNKKKHKLMLVMFLVDHDKAMDLAGTGTDELEGAEDVKTAREELKVLHEEKHRTEKIRATVKKELEVARTKTRKLEEVGMFYSRR